jgi:glycosyltransferase involved in cell wall biosynthesis
VALYAQGHYTASDGRGKTEKSRKMSQKPFTIVVPAFNEEGCIREVIHEIREALAGLEYELIVVDDGSSDRTAERAEEAGAEVLQQPLNRGYGSSLKEGIRKARYDRIVITDADGTYPADAIPSLVEGLDRWEMVVGARVGENVAIPLVRRPAKWLLGKIASYLAGRRIPDLNSGLRAMRKPLVLRYFHLLPPGFSFTTTITLSALCRDHLVHYQKIDYRPRVGDSKIRPRHAFDFLILILRTIVYFNPLKVFLPLGGAFFVAGLLKGGYDVWKGDFSESAVFAFLAGGLVWVVGLLSDQISRMGMRGE